MGRFWTESLIEVLIETVKKYEHIWNTNHPKYTRNKKIRHISWNEITKLFNESHKEIAFQGLEVLTKWNSLRLLFQKEHSKICEQGLEASSWRYYDQLTFLSQHPIQKRATSANYRKEYTLRKVVKQEDNENEETDVSIGSLSPRNLNSMEDSFLSEEMDLNKKCPGSDLTPESGRTVWETQIAFGNYIASEVMHLDSDLQLRAKKIIYNTLADLQELQSQRKRSAKW